MNLQASINASSGVSQLPLWSAANLAGMNTERLCRRAPFFQRLIKQVAGKCRAGLAHLCRPSMPESLPLLADAVVGSSRGMIFSVFGPPRGFAVAVDSDNSHDALWNAETWYYPLPRNGPIAMAINFHEDYASCVEFLDMGRD